MQEVGARLFGAARLPRIVAVENALRGNIASALTVEGHGMIFARAFMGVVPQMALILRIAGVGCRVGIAFVICGAGVLVSPASPVVLEVPVSLASLVVPAVLVLSVPVVSSLPQAASATARQRESKSAVTIEINFFI